MRFRIAVCIIDIIKVNNNNNMSILKLSSISRNRMVKLHNRMGKLRKKIRMKKCMGRRLRKGMLRTGRRTVLRKGRHKGRRKGRRTGRRMELRMGRCTLEHTGR